MMRLPVRVIACWISVIAVRAIAEVPATRPATAPASAPAVRPTTSNVVYRPDASEAERRKCTLDIYVPPGGRASAVIVWFHGGSMTMGDKNEAVKIVKPLNDAGVTLVTANYRLSPTVQYPAYVQDAAAAVAWVLDHPEQTGTTADRVFVGGYSAGGFLAFAVGAQPKWLAAHGHKPTELRGLVGVSPQVFTHFVIRTERGVPDPTLTPVIDEAAPIFHASADLPPVRLFVGDADNATRREELDYFIAVLKAKKHTDATLTVTQGRNHGTMTNHAAEPGDAFGRGLVDFIRTHAVAKPTTQAATRPAS